MESKRRDCEPCGKWKDLPFPPPEPSSGDKEKCPETLEEMCKQVNKQFIAWKEWGDGVNDTLYLYAQFIWRLEHAVCCLEGHVIYGKERPTEGWICGGNGKFQKGTLHTLVSPPWPLTPPPEEPWEE